MPVERVAGRGGLNALLAADQQPLLQFGFKR